MVSINKNKDYEIYLCNDSLVRKDAHLTVGYVLNGEFTPLCNVNVSIDAASSAAVHTLESSVVPDNAVLICDIKNDDKFDRAFYKNGNLHIVPEDNVEIISRTNKTIKIKASEYVHVAELEGEYIFEDNYFSLLPGEERTVGLRKQKSDAKEDITITGYTIL